MKKYIYHVTIILLLCLTACNSNRISPTLLKTDKLLAENPQKALRLLDSLPFSSRFSNEERMHYVWNKAKAHQLLGESLAEDTLLPKAVAYYRESGDSARLLDGYLLMASYLNWSGEKSRVSATLDSGYKIAVASKNISMMVKLLAGNAEYAYHNHDYNGAIQKITELLKYADSIPVRQRYFYTYLLGLNLSLANNPAYSDYYLQSINMALTAGDTVSACEVMRNFAGSLSGDHQYKRSNEQLQRIIQLMPKMGKLSAIQMQMAENFVNMHQLEEAKVAFKAASESEKILMSEGFADISRRGGIEMLKYLLDYNAGRNVSSSSFSRYCDSISNDVRMRRDTEIRQLESKRRLQAVNNELRMESQRMWWSLVTLIVILAVIGVAVYLYIRNRYYQLAEAENRIDTLTRLVDDAKSSIEDNPSEDNALFKKVLMKQLGIIKLVAATPTNQNQALLRRISEISEGEIPVDELLSWPELYPIIDSLYNNFYSHLMDTYGDLLKDKEVKICCLLCAGFSTKEIGVVTQQSDATIYVRKTAIRKKLGIDEKQDIVDFIKSSRR